MKKKILAISICVCICFALLAIPAFATSAPETTSAPNVFGTLFSSSDVVAYSYTITTWSQLPGLSGPVTVYGDYTFLGKSLHDGDVIYFFRTTGVDPYCRISINGSTSNIGSDYPSSYPDPLVVLESTYTNSGYSPAVVMTGTPVYNGSSGLVPELADEVFSVGGSLISFVMSHWIVLIPVVAFLVILCIGAIRKLIKGE